MLLCIAVVFFPIVLLYLVGYTEPFDEPGKWFSRVILRKTGEAKGAVGGDGTREDVGGGGGGGGKRVAKKEGKKER